MIFKSKELAELAAELTGAYQRRSWAPALCGENGHHPPLTPVITSLSDTQYRVIMSCLTCGWATAFLPYEAIKDVDFSGSPSPGVNVPM